MSGGRRLSTVATRSRTSWAAVVDVAIQVERGDDDRSALPGDRAQLVDAFDCVDDFFDRLRDRGLHFFRRSARQGRPNGNGRQIHRGKAIDAETKVTRRADHHQRQHDHRGEDRPADADFSELLHQSNHLSPAGRRRDYRAVRCTGSPTLIPSSDLDLIVETTTGMHAFLHRAVVCDGDDFFDAGEGDDGSYWAR